MTAVAGAQQHGRPRTAVGDDVDMHSYILHHLFQTRKREIHSYTWQRGKRRKQIQRISLRRF